MIKLQLYFSVDDLLPQRLASESLPEQKSIWSKEEKDWFSQTLWKEDHQLTIEHHIKLTSIKKNQRSLFLEIRIHSALKQEEELLIATNFNQIRQLFDTKNIITERLNKDLSHHKISIDLTQINTYPLLYCHEFQAGKLPHFQDEESVEFKNNGEPFTHLGWKGAIVLNQTETHLRKVSEILCFSQHSYEKCSTLREKVSTFSEHSIQQNTISAIQKLKSFGHELIQENNSLIVEFDNYKAGLYPRYQALIEHLWALWGISAYVNSTSTTIQTTNEFLSHRIALYASKTQEKQQFYLSVIAVVQTIAIISVYADILTFESSGHQLEISFWIVVIMIISMTVFFFWKIFSKKNLS